MWQRPCGGCAGRGRPGRKPWATLCTTAAGSGGFLELEGGGEGSAKDALATVSWRGDLELLTWPHSKVPITGVLRSIQCL